MRLIYRKKASIRAKIDRQMTIYHKFRRLALTYLASDKRKGCKLNFGVQGGATTDADLNMDEGFSAWSNMKTRMDKRMNGRGGKENIARNARRSSVAENDAYVLQGARKRRQSVEIEINDEMYENLQAITVDVGKRKLNKRERKLHRVVAQVNAASKLQNKSTDWSTGQIVRLPNGTFAAAFSPDNPNIGWQLQWVNESLTDGKSLFINGSLVGHRHRRRESVSVDSAAMAKAASLATLASTPTLNLNDIKYVRDTDAANKMPPTPPKDLTSERNDAFLRTCKEMRNLGDAP